MKFTKTHPNSDAAGDVDDADDADDGSDVAPAIESAVEYRSKLWKRYVFELVT